MEYTNLICYFSNLFDFDDWHEHSTQAGTMQSFIYIEGIQSFLAIQDEIIHLRQQSDYAPIMVINPLVDRASFDEMMDFLLKRINNIASRNPFPQIKEFLTFIHKQNKHLTPAIFNQTTHQYIERYGQEAADELMREFYDADDDSLSNGLSNAEQELCDQQILADYADFLQQFLGYSPLTQPFPKLMVILGLIAKVENLVSMIDKEDDDTQRGLYQQIFKRYIKKKGIQEYALLTAEISSEATLDMPVLHALSFVCNLPIKTTKDIIQLLKNDGTLFYSLSSYPSTFSYLYNYVTLNYHQLENGARLFVEVYFNEGNGMDDHIRLQDEIAMLNNLQLWELFLKQTQVVITMAEIESAISAFMHDAQSVLAQRESPNLS